MNERDDDDYYCHDDDELPPRQLVVPRLALPLPLPLRPLKLLLLLLLGCAGNLEPIIAGQRSSKLGQLANLEYLAKLAHLGGRARQCRILVTLKSWSSRGVARLPVNVAKLKLAILKSGFRLGGRARCSCNLVILHRV